MKGIVLAGGKGTRLFPITNAISKQLIPIYDKPMIYYPLSILMLAGIREILIISDETDIENYHRLLGDGSQFGISLSYEIQLHPNGIAEAFIIGEDFIADDCVALILGDNIFYGQGFTHTVQQSALLTEGAIIFGYPVNNPTEFGVVEFDENMKAICIEEKPQIPKSNYAIPGLYFYDNQVVTIAKSIKPSHRGELEISSINQAYLKNKKLNVKLLGRGHAWLDAGTASGMLQASIFVETIQARQNLYIACLEEIAWRMQYISTSDFSKLVNSYCECAYTNYLRSLSGIRQSSTMDISEAFSKSE